METKEEIREELKRLWMARSHALQQIHAGEDTFRAMPTFTKAQQLANRRHECHLIELDIVEFDNKMDDVIKAEQEQAKRNRNIMKALKDLEKTT